MNSASSFFFCGCPIVGINCDKLIFYIIQCMLLTENVESGHEWVPITCLTRTSVMAALCWAVRSGHMMPSRQHLLQRCLKWWWKDYFNSKCSPVIPILLSVVKRNVTQRIHTALLRLSWNQCFQHVRKGAKTHGPLASHRWGAWNPVRQHPGNIACTGVFISVH